MTAGELRFASPADPLAVVRDALEHTDCQPRGPEHDFMAWCAAHDDRTPSLHVSEGADGRVLLHCFAGCEPEAIVAALGLEWRDLFPPDAAAGWPKRTRDRYVELAGRVSEERIARYERARRRRDGNVFLDALVQVLRNGLDFSGSLAFTCPWCQVGQAWMRRDHAGLAVDCDPGRDEHDVLGGLAELERAA